MVQQKRKEVSPSEDGKVAWGRNWKMGRSQGNGSGKEHQQGNSDQSHMSHEGD